MSFLCQTNVNRYVASICEHTKFANTACNFGRAIILALTVKAPLLCSGCYSQKCLSPLEPAGELHVFTLGRE